MLQLAAKTMGVLDQRSRRELVKAISSGSREVELKSQNGGRWQKVMSATTTSDFFKAKLQNPNSRPATDMMSRGARMSTAPGTLSNHHASPSYHSRTESYNEGDIEENQSRKDTETNLRYFQTGEPIMEAEHVD